MRSIAAVQTGVHRHIPTSAIFDYAVGQGVSLSAEITAVTIREGSPVETLLGWDYVCEVSYTI